MPGGEFRACVIGLGRIGWKWETNDLFRVRPCTHVGAYLKHPDVDLVAVCDVNEEVLREFRSSFGDVRTYSDYVVMVREEKPDIVSIATPVETHFSIARSLVKQGVPVVFCEKPLASTVSESVKLCNIVEKSDTALVVNHTRRWSKVWEWFKSEVAGEGLPSLFVGKFSGHWFEVGVHMADVYNWISKGSRDFVINCDLQYVLFEVEVFFDDTALALRGNGDYVEKYVVRENVKYSGRDLYLSEVVSTTCMDVVSPMYRAVSNIVNYLKFGDELKCTHVDGMRAVEKCYEWGERFGLKVRRGGS